MLKQQIELQTDLSLLQVKNRSEIPGEFYAIDDKGENIDVIELLYSGDNVIFCFDDKACMQCVHDEIETLNNYFPDLHIYFYTNSSNYEKINHYVKVFENIKVLYASVEFEKELFESHLPFYMFYDEHSNILKKFYTFKEVPDLTISFLQNIYGTKTL